MERLNGKITNAIALEASIQDKLPVPYLRKHMGKLNSRLSLIKNVVWDKFMDRSTHNNELMVMTSSQIHIKNKIS